MSGESVAGAAIESLDWDDVRRRVADAARIIESAAKARSPEEIRAILDARALALARQPVAVDGAEALELITFVAGSERHGIEQRYVHAVARVNSVAVLPGATPPLLGVVGWRGELLTILDLAAILGRPSSPRDQAGAMIVLGDHRAEFGVLVDAVEGLATVRRDAITGAQRNGMLGITDDAMVVLDGSRLLRHTHGGTV